MTQEQADKLADLHRAALTDYRNGQAFYDYLATLVDHK